MPDLFVSMSICHPISLIESNCVTPPLKMYASCVLCIPQCRVANSLNTCVKFACNNLKTLFFSIMFSAVCTVDYDTFRTFDGVEFQYSSPLQCPHVLAKDCAGESFMVLLSKEANASGNNIVEIFVEKQKIRAEYVHDGSYQIQVWIFFPF